MKECSSRLGKLRIAMLRISGLLGNGKKRHEAVLMLQEGQDLFNIIGPDLRAREAIRSKPVCTG
jgi:hypothetical protein